MKILYEGGLGETVADWVKSAMEEFPFMVEVRSNLNFNPDILKTRTWYQELDMDAYTGHKGGHKRTGPLYCQISKNPYEDESDYFVGLKDKDDHTIFVETHSDYVVDSRPFKVIL